MSEKIINKKLYLGIIIFLICIVFSAGAVLFADENKEETISDGIFISYVDVSGMTYNQAVEAVNGYINTLNTLSVNVGIGENIVSVPVAELGLTCDVEGVVKHSVGFGKSGNIVKRYKEKKDLEVNGSIIPLELDFSDDSIRNVLQQKCTVFDVQAVDAGLQKTSDGFVVTEGKSGVVLDVEASLTTLKTALKSNWNGSQETIALVTTVTEPRAAGADLDKVGDLLGSATTSYSKSGKARCGNVERGASLINGTVLYPGDEFSTYAVVNPITLENGYFMAASYENGQVVESPGGGICQVSTTLYNAVLKSELEITQRSNHSMIVTYVDPSKDAAIAGTYKDLKFVNNTNYPIYIEGITAGKNITFNIYGVETRSATRTIEYVSETISETEVATKIQTTGDNFGTISTSGSPHKGVVAQLWKIEYENGVEVARNVVNKSTYSMSPRVLNVGTANASPEAMNELNAAIAANNEAAVRDVVSRYAASIPPEGTTEIPTDTEGVVTPEQTVTQDGQSVPQNPQEQQPTQEQPQEQQPVQETPQENEVVQQPVVESETQPQQ